MGEGGQAALDQMLDAMTYRGPDDRGALVRMWILKVFTGSVLMIGDEPGENVQLRA